LEYGTFEIPRPDLIIYLDVPHSVSVKHMNKGATDRAVADAVENDVQYQLNARQSALAMLQDPTWVKIQCGTDDGEDFLPIQEINDIDLRKHFNSTVIKARFGGPFCILYSYENSN